MSVWDDLELLGYALYIFGPLSPQYQKVWDRLNTKYQRELLQMAEDAEPKPVPEQSGVK